ncbi:MAG TPA: hypothetical protein VNG04_00010 [Candidatus Acidoferrum sp.]|nr:hypothetical protein [Candidatus Acidoferrum sp.]
MEHRTRASRTTQALMLIANVAWLGGLIRLIGEAVARGMSSLAPTEANQRTVVLAVVGGIALLGVEALLLWRWPWYRGILRQSQEDIRSLWGVSPNAAPTFQIIRTRSARSAALMLVPALVAAAVLPGPIAAAVAVVVGLAIRVAVVVAVMGVTRLRD